MKSFLLWVLAFLALGLYITQCSQKLNKPSESLDRSSIQRPQKRSKGVFAAKGKVNYYYSYKVKSGETLFSLGQKLGIPWQKIARDNGLEKPWTIYPGQWLKMRLSAPVQKMAWASWYGRPFHGRQMANGERYNMNYLLTAHKTLPLGTKVWVRNPENGIGLILEVKDRGPYIKGREFDLSRKAAQILGFKEKGLAELEVEILELG